MLTRRDLLRHLFALPMAAQVDLEQLLWVPKPIVTVPAWPSDPWACKVPALMRPGDLVWWTDSYPRAMSSLRPFSHRETPFGIAGVIGAAGDLVQSGPVRVNIVPSGSVMVYIRPSMVSTCCS